MVTDFSILLDQVCGERTRKLQDSSLRLLSSYLGLDDYAAQIVAPYESTDLKAHVHEPSGGRCCVKQLTQGAGPGFCRSKNLGRGTSTNATRVRPRGWRQSEWCDPRSSPCIRGTICRSTDRGRLRSVSEEADQLAFSRKQPNEESNRFRNRTTSTVYHKKNNYASHILLQSRILT